MKKAGLTILFALFSIVMSNTVQAQCPMCKTALKSNRENSGGKATVGNGINKGILFLLSMPYVMVAAAGFAWYRGNQKKKQNA